MNVRTSSPIQYRIIITFQREDGSRFEHSTIFGFNVEPTKMRLRVVANQLGRSLARDVKGITLINSVAERIGA